ncbi:MAG: LCP family protein [Solibacillus sp.]|uniref:LCP family protein n=1 Tax=Solibacillus sp. TaxID=1909654 RepID=UPI003314E524
MEDKRIRDQIFNSSDQDLRFTKEDRNKVFDQIHNPEKNKAQKKSIIFSKNLVPLTVSLLVVGLCLFLFMPSILPSEVINESSPSVTREPVGETEFLTSLITVKSIEMENRIYLNLLLTYSKDKKMVKIVSIPHDTYAPIGINNDGSTMYDKLLFAYRFGGAENVRSTVSKLVDLPIDYYAVIDLETISALIDAMDGIDYDLQEDIRIRAISQVAFEFDKGTNHLNGEEVVALMMAATEGISLEEQNLLNLMNAVMNKTENEIPPTQLKELFSKIEANVSLNGLLQNQIEINTIKTIPLSDGMVSEAEILSSTEGKHYYKFGKDFLNSVSEELTTFN